MDPLVTALVALASTAIGWFGKIALEAVRSKRHQSMRPPPSAATVFPPKPSVSGQIRAITRQQEEERMRELEHEAIMSMQQDNARQVALLERLVAFVTGGNVPPEPRPVVPGLKPTVVGKYRAKLPSSRGGE